MPEINGARLLEDLHTLRSFGACGTGVVRPSLSETDLASRRWLCERLREAGLQASIDGVGTVFGRSAKPSKALLLGSHTDTQPTGGWLDGALGVMYALEVARTLAETAETSHLAVDVASWIDEEGTYVGLLGSRSFCDDMPAQLIVEGMNQDGHLLTDALTAAGLDGVPVVRMDPDRYLGYLEAHIEQGPQLEAEDKHIGVVTAIIGMRDYEITFVGQQNHAGTTPMALRKDAGAALIQFASRVQTEFPRVMRERTVFTIGQVSFEPGAPSIVPGKARMLLQFRDPDEAVLEELQSLTETLVDECRAAGVVGIEMTNRGNDCVAAHMNEGLQQHIAAAAERHAPGHWVFMPSGAAHDAQTIATRLPSAMLFIPSIGGISHDFTEDSRPEDIVLGCQVMASAATSILRG